MRHLFMIFLFVVAHVGVVGLSVVGGTSAQNSPDCTACALECVQNAEQCRAEADERFVSCVRRVLCSGRESCTRRCRATQRSEISTCDRREASCVGNCYI